MRALYDSKSRTIDDKGIKQLLSKEKKYQTWLDVEAALAQAQGELGVIPLEDSKVICQSAKIENIDLEEVDKIYQKIGHGFMPFLKVFAKACGEKSGKFVHFGVTTQNIQQTSQLLILKQVNEKIQILIKNILNNLAKLALEYKDTCLPGRTHGQHALPITYGYKVAVWIDELLKSLERMKESEKRIFCVMMGGAVGAFNSSGNIGRKVQKRVAEILNMYEMDIPSRNISYHKIEYIMNLSLVVSTAHKVAEEVYYTSGAEYNEVAEAFKEGTVGSSTMPQKVNPKLSKGIIANSQKLYSLITPLLYSAPRMFEGDSSSYMLQDGILEEAMELIAEILPRFEELTRTLRINKEAMKNNLLLTHGLINSEFIMMSIANKLGKNQAHELIYEIAMKAKSGTASYKNLLLQNKVIQENFTEDEILYMLDPKNYTGESSSLAQIMVEKVKNL